MRYNFPDHYKGDATKLVTINSGMDLTGASIILDYRLTKNGPSALRQSTALGTIVISATPTDMTFTIPSQIINIASGKYFFDIEITPSTGLPVTIIEGTRKIKQDVSHE